MFLLDTNVLSEVTKPAPNRNVLHWFASIDEDRLFLSVVSLAEIRRGIALLPEGKRRKSLATWLEHDLLQRFERRILPVNVATALAWGDLMGVAKRAGRAVSSLDGLLAATAQQSGTTLVTRNVKDFSPWRIALVNPFEHTAARPG